MPLSDFVKTYSDFGCHRTGCETQLATENWLLEILETRSNTLSRFNFTYPHFQFESSVMIEGRIVPSLPIYYEATGKFIGSKSILCEPIIITESENEVYTRINEITTRAKASGCGAVVLASTGMLNSLYAMNVTPVLKNNLPVVLVPGNESHDLLNGNVHLDYFASVSERCGQNLVARLGTYRSQAPIVITTPMSGWFNCAGERGAGLALAIELAIQLGKTNTVELILTSGHELSYLGGFAYAKSIKTLPAAVIHVGSCVGADNADLSAWYNDCGINFSSLDPLLNEFHITTTNVKEPHSSKNWVGEAECWAQFGCPMISIAGINPLFHTPADQWQVAVTENSLEEMYSVLAEIGELVGSTFSL